MEFKIVKRYWNIREVLWMEMNLSSYVIFNSGIRIINVLNVVLQKKGEKL